MICINPHASKSLSQACLDDLLKLITCRCVLILSFLPFAAYGQFLKANGEQPVTWKRASSMDEVLQEADLVRILPRIYRAF
jgi:hypothetical protein